MTLARARAALLVLGALLALALVTVGATSTAPELTVPPRPRLTVTAAPPTTTQSPSPVPGRPTGLETLRPARKQPIVGEILLTLLVLAAAAALVIALWILRRARLFLPARGDEIDAVDDSPVLTAEPGRVALDRAARLLAEPDGAGDPIVAAYRALEAEIGRAGVPRRSSETSIDHVTRALAALDLSEADLREFAGLYGRALFAGVPSMPADRARARHLLAALADQLEAAR